MTKISQEINVKMLVDQNSGLVVWMSTKRQDIAPTIFPTLDFVHFDGTIDMRIGPPYIAYKLYFKDGEFSEGNSVKETPEFKNIQLLRAKATAVVSATGMVRFNYERLNLTNTNYYDQLINLDTRWVDLYSNTFNCSRDESLKLINFYIDEYKNATFILESELFLFIEKVKQANSLKELENELFIHISKGIGRYFVLSDLPIVRGYE